MAEAVKTGHPHVARVEGACGGEPVMDGVRVAVRHVVTLHRRGETVLGIAAALGITGAPAFHALSYFFDHPDGRRFLIAYRPPGRYTSNCLSERGARHLPGRCRASTS